MAQAVYLPEIPSKIVKWKVSHGSHVGQGTVLCLYEPVGTSKQLRLRCSEVGTVRELTAKEGDVITARFFIFLVCRMALTAWRTILSYPTPSLSNSITITLYSMTTT